MAIVLALVLAFPAVAWAHVPILEPAGTPSDARGPAADPFPDAINIAGPQVSRAVYGFLAPGEKADVYAFTVPATITVPVQLLVPAEDPGAARFRPELSIYGPGAPVGLYDRDGAPRSTFYEPFSFETLYQGPSKQVTFAPGGRYFAIVTPGKGSVTSGRYVIGMGTVEAFGPDEVANVPVSIATIVLGSYGGAPVRQARAAGLGLVCAVPLVALLAVVWWAWRRRRARRVGDNG
jgi:hypothetical protein